MSNLFKDFKPVSAAEWKQKIQVDLKGKDYNSLLTKTPEGIDLKPFYHPEDQEAQSVSSAENWWVTSKIYIADDSQATSEIKTALDKGVEYLWLIAESQDVDIPGILREVDFGETPVILDFNAFPPTDNQISTIDSLLKEKNTKAQVSFDPLGKLAQSGNWFTDQSTDLKTSEKLIDKFKSPLFISGDIFQNAGANSVQQVAYALSQAVEYLHSLNEETNKDIKFHFKMATGSNYFMEIAKLRALRLLFAQVAKEFNNAEDIEILAFPTRRDKSIYDYNINLLRTTTESMSAILGGADQVCNAPYDEIYHNTNDFGSRISRNQLLILKHESYFNAVQNPAEGSYYIESLTEDIGKKALDIFKMIEKSGGFLASLKDGTIQKKIKENAAEEQADFDAGRLTLVGVNAYQNPEDKMKNELERSPFLQKNKRKTILEPVIPRRLAEKLEQERLKEEA